MKKTRILFIFFAIITVLLVPKQVFSIEKNTSETINFPYSYMPKVDGISTNQLYYNSDDIYQHDTINNTFTQIWTVSGTIFSAYVDDNYLYIWSFYQGDSSMSRITCVNIDTSVEMFSYTVPLKGIYNGSIAADSKQNVYILSDYIMEYDKNGNFVGQLERESNGNRVSSLIGFNNDDTVLFVGMNYYNEGAIKLTGNNISTGNIYFINYRRIPVWSFIDDTTAINQFGELAIFDFTGTSSKPFTYTLKIQGFSSNYSSVPVYYDTENSIFISNGSGDIVEYDKSTYKKLYKLEIYDGATINKITEKDGDLYIAYSIENSDNETENYVTRVSLTDKVSSKVITITEHSSQKHTLEQVKEQYIAAKPTFDYDNNSLYETEPVLTTPYYEGSLKNEVQNDTLKQINFYRWLSSLNSVTINTDKMARSQKGALLLDVIDTLTHYPSQPVDMDDAFYEEAYDGVNAGYSLGDTYSGNVSYGTRIDQSIKTFIEDRNNVEAGVGHRSNLLDPYAYAISFGYVRPYAAVSMYYDDTNENQDTFYPYPTAGYFPTESLYSEEETMWSVWIGDNYKYSSDTKVELIYNNKTYTVPKLYYDTYTTTISYYVPEELRSLIETTNGRYLNGATVEVRVLNLLDNDINTVNLEYSTTFVSVEDIELESIEMLTAKEGSQLYSVTTPGKTIKLDKGVTYNYEARVLPTNSLVSNLSFKIADTSIATIDPVEGKIITHKGGKTTLTVKEETTGKVFEYEIHVQVDALSVSFAEKEITIEEGQKLQLNPIFDPIDASFVIEDWRSFNSKVATVDEHGVVTGISQGTATIYYREEFPSNPQSASIKINVVTPISSVSLSESSITIENGETATLTASINPETTNADKTLTWKSSSPSIATVDENGKITAKFPGKTTITVTTVNGKTATCEVTVTGEAPYIMGDLNNSGRVSITDVVMLVKLNFNKLELNDYYLAVGDMNHSGRISVTDVVLLVKTIFGKI